MPLIYPLPRPFSTNNKVRPQDRKKLVVEIGKIAEVARPPGSIQCRDRVQLEGIRVGKEKPATRR